MDDHRGMPHSGDVFEYDPNHPAERLESEMSGLRSRLSGLRAQSLNAATDLLAVLVPLPHPLDRDVDDQGIEYVTASRETRPLAAVDAI